MAEGNINIKALKFIKGLNTDVHPSDQIEDTTREVRNFVFYSKDGNLNTLTNENGTCEVSFSNSIPAGFMPIGYTILNEEIYMIIANDAGQSQFGKVVSRTRIGECWQGEYTPLAPVDFNTGDPDFFDDIFLKEHPVDAEARKLINGDVVFYFTDNYNPIGRISVSNPPKTNDPNNTVEEQLTLIPSQTIPRIQLVNVNDTGGSLVTGAYWIVTRYVTENGGRTKYGIPSNRIDLNNSLKQNGVNSYKGAPPGLPTTKNITINLTNVDTQYQEVELLAIAITDDTSVPSIYTIRRIPITGDTINDIVITSLNTEVAREPIDSFYASMYEVEYNYAKCIEQKDNTLFLSNLRSDPTINYTEIQELIANNVKVRYGIYEMPYCGRGEVGSTPPPTTIFAVTTATPLQETPADAPIVEGTTSNDMVDATSATLFQTEQAVEFSIEVVTPNAGFTIELTNKFSFITDNFSTVTEIADYIRSLGDYVVWEDGNFVRFYIIGEYDTPETLTLSPATADYVVSQTSYTTNVISYNSTSISFSGRIVQAGFSVIPKNGDRVSFFGLEDANGDRLNGDTVTGSFNLPYDATGGAANNPTTVPQGFTDYINEVNCFNFTTYRREEVYSLGFFFIFKDGRYSPVFHIPGDSTYDSSAFPLETVVEDYDDTLTVDTDGDGILAAYVSNVDYPPNRGYPNGKIRHHRMPSWFREPITNADGTIIRALNLKFKDLDLSVIQGLEDKVLEVVFVREPRDKTSQKSIYGQGLFNHMLPTGDNYSIDDDASDASPYRVGGLIVGPRVDTYEPANTEEDGANPQLTGEGRDSYCLKECPYANRFWIDIEDNVAFDTCPVVGGIAWRADDMPNPYVLAGLMTAKGHVPSLYNGAFDLREYENLYVYGRRVMFHSPDVDLNIERGYTPSDLVNMQFRCIGNYGADTHIVDQAGGNWEWITEDDAKWMITWHFQDHFFDYKYPTTDGYAETSTIRRATFRQTNESRGPSISSRVELGTTIQDFLWRTSTEFALQGWEFDLEDQILEDAIGIEQWIQRINASQNTSNVSSSEDGDKGVRDVLDSNPALEDTHYNKVINITNRIPEQYQDVATASYIPIGRHFYQPNAEYINFGGDTYITKYGLSNAQLIPYVSTKYVDRGGDILRVETQRTIADPELFTYSFRNRDRNIEYTQDLSKLHPKYQGKAYGFDFRQVQHFFVESTVNTYYRYQFFDDQGLPGPNYFPNEPNLINLLGSTTGGGGWNPILDGRSVEYNLQNSFDLPIRYQSIPDETEIISTFENRTIYSETAATDDVVDVYRNFPAANYYDLPSDTGPIWDSFTYNNTLFLHTPKCLWETFAEPAATLQGGNIEDIVLGTGSLFQRPSRKLVTSEGGYGGTVSQFTGVYTPIGYIFVDALQGKVFSLGTTSQGSKAVNSLQDIGKLGLKTFFHDNLRVNEEHVNTLESHLIDNPYIGIGFTAVHDHLLNRYILVIHENNLLNIPDETVSMSMLLNNWASFHDYHPEVMMQYNNRVICFNEGIMHDMNKGEKGNFFGTVYDSRLLFAITYPYNVTYVNLEIDSESLENNISIINDNFYSLRLFTDKQDTITRLFRHYNDESQPIIPDEITIPIKHRNDVYRVALPRDNVTKARVRNSYALFDFVYKNRDDNTGDSFNIEFSMRLMKLYVQQNFR